MAEFTRIAFSSRESPSDEKPSMAIPNLEAVCLIYFQRCRTSSAVNLLSVPKTDMQYAGAS